MKTTSRKEKLITVKREKVEDGVYRIHEFEDGKETNSYFAKCKSKFGLTQVDSRGFRDKTETFSCGEGLAHHCGTNRVFYVDAFGRVQGPYKLYFWSTLDGKKEYTTYYKDGIEQSKNFSRPRVEMTLKGISSRLQKLFFGSAKKQVNLKEIKSRNTRE